MNRHRAAQLPRFAAGCLVFLLATGCPPPGGDVERTLVKSLCTLSCIGDEPEASDEITVMLPGEVPLELVWIPQGSFWIGRYNGEQPSQSSESPRHEVVLSFGFWLGKYEVTKRQWQALMGTTPWDGKPFVSTDPDSPAVFLSWRDAAEFIDFLCSYTGEPFRLPSKRNGSTRAGRERRRNTIGARMKAARISMRMPGGLVFAMGQGNYTPILSVSRHQMISVSSTWAGTRGNGVKTTCMTTTTVRRGTAAPGWTRRAG